MSEPEEKVVEPANPAEEPATAAEPETEDFAGYESLEAMKAAIYASRKEGKRLADEVATLRAESGRRLPSESKAARSALEEIDELGLPAETFKRAVREEIARELAPKQSTDAAVASIRRANPDFARFEAQFTDWLADNPQVGLTYANTVAAAPESAELALEGVFAQFSRAAAAAVKKPDPATRKISPDAAIPDTQNTGGSTRRGAAPKLSPADVRELIKGARANNDPVPLMRAMGMGTVVPVHRDIESKKG